MDRFCYVNIYKVLTKIKKTIIIKIKKQMTSKTVLLSLDKIRIKRTRFALLLETTKKQIECIKEEIKVSFFTDRIVYAELR